MKEEKMIIEFPQFVDFSYFYRFLLNDFQAYLNSDNYDDLVLDLQYTEYMSPSVLCDMLCFFKYQRDKKGGQVVLALGNSTKLRTYLEDAMFFYHSERQTLFSTDIINYRSIGSGGLRELNTNKIKRINIPADTSLGISYSAKKEYYDQIEILYNKYKKEGMEKLGLSNKEEVREAFLQIIINAYEHSNDHQNYGCYYTFQNYIRSGLDFACSDIGGGFYQSRKAKYLHYQNNKASYEKAKKKPVIPQIFTLEEFLSLQFDDFRRELAAILESLVFRIREQDFAEYGFPYIFKVLVLPCHGTIQIHSVNTLLIVDKAFIDEFFIIGEKKKIGNEQLLSSEKTEKKEYIIRDFNKEALRKLVFDPQILEEKRRKRIIQFYDYSFPGAHLSVHIDGGTING